MSPSRGPRTGWIVPAALAGCWAVVPRAGPARDPEITTRLGRSVDLGLTFLVTEQERTRSFRSDDFPVAANALAGLALLAGGYTDHSGPPRFSRAVGQCTAAILRHQKQNGVLDGYIDDGGRSRMYGHGFATLYLAELYGMSPSQDATIREALRRAIRLIERSQGREGGWDYTPSTGSGPSTRAGIVGDTSITVCQIMALRAARNLGIGVEPAVVERARGFVGRAQNPDGGFRYRLGSGMFSGSAFPRSAAGVCILYSLGDYSSPQIERGLDYLERHYRRTEVNFPFYAHYYCSQAMFQVGGRQWQEYFPWIRERLLGHQRNDFSWRPGRFETSTVACTAMALVILQLPYRFLPIHER